MTQQSEKAPPDILEEEDTPLHSAESGEGEKEDRKLSKEKNALNLLDNQKFHLGSTTLGWCIVLMLACICLSLRWPDNELVQSGFEAFKLIVMTILGYIFGSNNSKGT